MYILSFDSAGSVFWPLDSWLRLTGSTVWGLSSHGPSGFSWVAVRGLTCPTACGILLPWPGIQSETPALEDGFLTTGPPGESIEIVFFMLVYFRSSVPCSSVTQPCPTLCNPTKCSTPGFPVHYQIPELQTHVHRVSDAIQPSHPLLSPSPPAFNLSQHQGLFQWASSLHQVAKVLELQLQHLSSQWIFRSYTKKKKTPLFNSKGSVKLSWNVFTSAVSILP